MQHIYNLANFAHAKIAEWFNANKLILNTSKTKYLLIKKKQESVIFESLKLFIDDKEIDRVGAECKHVSFKFVGINRDEYLKWSYQSYQCSKKQDIYHCYALVKVRNLLPSNIKLILFNSLFRSYLEYVISCWGKMHFLT